MKKLSFICFLVIGFGSACAKADVNEALKIAITIQAKSGFKGHLNLVKAHSQFGPPIELLGPISDPYQKIRTDPKADCYEFVIDSPDQVIIQINKATNSLYSFSWSGLIKHIVRPEGFKPPLAMGTCQQKAVAWMEAIGCPLPSTTILTESKSIAGAFSFEWSDSKDNQGNTLLIPPSISVEVDYLTGKVATYARFDFTLAQTNFHPKYTQDEAVKIASAAISGYKVSGGFSGGGAGVFRRAFLKVVSVPAYKDKPYSNALVWNLEFHGGWIGNADADKKTLPIASKMPLPGEGAVDWEIILYDGTKIVDGIPHVRFENVLRTTVKTTVRRCSPMWGSDNQLLYVSSDPIKGDPSATNPDDPQLVVLCQADLLPTGGVKTTALFKMGRGLWRGSSLATWSNKRGFTWSQGGAVWLVDPKTGFLTQCHDSERIFRSNPSWSADGAWLATAGSHSPTDKIIDEDIFIFNVFDEPSLFGMQNQRSVARFSGTDTLPIWNPTTPSVAFIHQEAETKYALYTVKVGELITVGKKATPEKILEMPAPYRLSFFPDGKRILASYESDSKVSPTLDVIDIKTKTRIPLKLPVLLDPDLPQGLPLQMREPVVSPNGKKIAFSALRWTGNFKDDGVICIYTCNLDGSSLKRITPATNEVLESYNYPQPGVTAFNAWEKLQPKPNVGVIYDPDDPKSPGSRAFIEELQRKIEEERKTKAK